MNDLTYDQKLRIEALRASSRLMSGAAVGIKTIDGYHDIENNALELAEHFYKYLEGKK